MRRDSGIGRAGGRDYAQRNATCAFVIADRRLEILNADLNALIYGNAPQCAAGSNVRVQLMQCDGASIQRYHRRELRHCYTSYRAAFAKFIVPASCLPRILLGFRCCQEQEAVLAEELAAARLNHGFE